MNQSFRAANDGGPSSSDTRTLERRAAFGAAAWGVLLVLKGLGALTILHDRAGLVLVAMGFVLFGLVAKRALAARDTASVP